MHDPIMYNQRAAFQEGWRNGWLDAALSWCSTVARTSPDSDYARGYILGQRSRHEGEPLTP